jgi:cytochrome P450
MRSRVTDVSDLTDDVDLTDPARYSGGVPHELFTELRAKGAVHRHQGFVDRRQRPVEFWSVVRHAEIQQANRDWQAFSAIDGPGLARTSPERRGHMIVSMDPPEHSRHRKLISAGFTPRMIGELEGHITRRTTQIVDALAQAGSGDFVRDVAYQLPMHVIADIVGIPEDDRPWVFQRTEAMLLAYDPASGITEAQRREAEADLFQYAQALGLHKRANPADDIWTVLTNAEIVGDDGDPSRLAELELDLFVLVLALAGSETTRNAISQGMMALLAHPDQLHRLRADPSLLSSATDEMIRWSSPVLYFGRTATCDVDLGGQQISAGDRVVLWYPSGNRDERAFDQPFAFDVGRQPNNHVSFGGGGPHYCLGASLAKKEVQVMIGSLLARFSTIELASDPQWSGAGPEVNVGVSVLHMPVRVVPR